MSCRSRLRAGVNCVNGMLKKSEPALVGAYDTPLAVVTSYCGVILVDGCLSQSNYDYDFTCSHGCRTARNGLLVCVKEIG